MTMHIKSWENDSYLVFFVTLYFIMEAVNLFVKLFLGGFSTWGIFSKGILFICMIPAVLVVARRKKDLSIFILLEIFVLAFLSFTYLRGTASSTFLKNSIYIIGIYLPIGICVGTIKDKKKLLISLYRIRFIPHIMLLITLMAFRDGAYNYSMPASYALLLWALVTTDHFMNVCKRKLDIFLVVLDVAVVFMRGSRGVLLCFLAYIFLDIMLEKRGVYPRKVFLCITVIAAVAGVIILNRLLIFKVIYDWMLKHGYQSRAMWTLANNLFYSSGRGLIYQNYMERISNNALFGYGFLGGIEEGMAIPHNAVLEIVFYFGVPMGVILFTWYIYHILKVCTYRENIMERRLMMITVSILISTLFSNEIFLTPFFYIGAALALNRKEIGNYSDKTAVVKV